MFDKNYPYLASWISTAGWVYLGSSYDYNSWSWLRLFNDGGLVWQDEDSKSLEEALQNAESYLKNDLLNDFGIELEIEE